MKSIKLLTTVAATCLSLSATLVAHAATSPKPAALQFSNNTTSDITTKLDNGGCSADLLGPAEGILKPGAAPLKLPTALTDAGNLCNFVGGATSCSVAVYADDDCKGTPIATASVDKNYALINKSGAINYYQTKNAGGTSYVVVG